MATIADAEKEYAYLQDLLATIGNIDLTEGRVGFATLNNKRYSLADIRAIKADAEDRVSKLDKVLSPVREAQASLVRAQEIAKNPIIASPTGLSQEQANADVAAAMEQVKRATSRSVTVPKAEVAMPTPAVTAGAAPAGGGAAVVPAPVAAAAGGGARGGTAEEIAAYQASLKKPKRKAAVPVPGGPAGGAVTGGKTPTVKGMPWEKVAARFREMFPGQSWVLDIDPAKYPDVQKLIRRAQQQNMTAERFAAEWQNTSFYREAASTGIVRQITQLVGDVGFDTKPLNAFVTTAMNMGWSGATLQAEAYKEAFRKDDQGAFVNPIAVDRVKKSRPYLDVANIGKEYFNQVADNTVQQVLTGDMSQEDVIRQQRELAKSRYGHLSSLLDQGLTLQDIGDNYRTQAAQLLEKDPNSIDMSQADYEVALNFGEPDKKRLMTQGEWQRLLRTDRKYGWEKTENAKDEARQLANNMVKIFGRVI